MATAAKTVIVTGASQGIGAGIAKAFLDRGYRVVASSRHITKSGAFSSGDHLAACAQGSKHVLVHMESISHLSVRTVSSTHGQFVCPPDLSLS